jgi:hypothetical protein
MDTFRMGLSGVFFGRVEDGYKKAKLVSNLTE